MSRPGFKLPALIRRNRSAPLLAAATFLLPLQSPAQDPWPWAVAPTTAGIEMLLLGDFNVQKRADPTAALTHVQATLNAADLVYANLEGLLVPSVGPADDLPNKNGWTHLGTESVAALNAGNIAAVGAANNVAWGHAHIEASLAVLDAHGIAHTGAGANLVAAHEPAIIERQGVRIGFLQYTSKWYDEAEQMAGPDIPGVARLKSPDGEQLDPGDLDLLLADIRSLRARVDIVVVSAHTRDGQGRAAGGSGGGARGTLRPADDLYSRLPVNENLQYFEPYQQVLAHAAIDAGADIVFGHGCHMLQAVESYAGKPIFYCLGNFASDWIRVRDYTDGLVARILIEDKALSGVSLVPVTRDADNNVYLVAPGHAEGERLYTQLLGLSAGAQLRVHDNELVLDLTH